MFALERAKDDFTVNLVALGLMLTVGVSLAYTYGVIGAVWGLIVSNAAATLLRATVFSRRTAPRHA